MLLLCLRGLHGRDNAIDLADGASGLLLDKVEDCLVGYLFPCGDVVSMKGLEDVIEGGIDKDIILADVPSEVDAMDLISSIRNVCIQTLELLRPLWIHIAKLSLHSLVTIDLHIARENGRGVSTDLLVDRVGVVGDLDLGVIREIDDDSLILEDADIGQKMEDAVNSSILNTITKRGDRANGHTERVVLVVEDTILVKDTHKPHDLRVDTLADLTVLGGGLKDECIGVIGVEDGAEAIKEV